MRSALVILTLGTLGLLWACADDVRPEQTVTNNTDTLLCYYQYGPVPNYCPQVQPHSTQTFAAGCPSREQNLTIVLTAGPGGPVVYQGTATCHEWIRTSGKIKVEQSASGFTVEDSLPDATPSPQAGRRPPSFPI
jgi:hypothetical protein